jgi:glyoxylase-like metal-dependent hydrolase (beta-lactamase superfamily II)
MGTNATRGDVVKYQLAGFVSTGVAVCAIALAQQPPADVQIQTQKITDNVYMLLGEGGNVGVTVGADGVAIIDDQFDRMVPKIRAAVAMIADQPIRFVINTHWHGDHTGGNAALGRIGSVIVAHGNVRKRMSAEHVSGLTGRKTPPSPPEALPIVTFDQAVTLHLNGDQLEVTHVRNAHTDGDAIIRFRNANVLHMGDTFFNGLYPFIDTSSGGSISGLIAALDQVLPSIDESTRIIPGHGPLASKADLQAYRDMLATARDRIAKLVRAGKTQEEVLAAAPTKDFDAKWGGGFLKPDAWVGRMYVDLKRERESKKR